MRKKVFVFYCLLNCCFQQLIAQTPSALPNIMLPSPTAMQFQRYGDYPVNTFTGVPGISIPLFTIKEGDLTLPITLNYHASGCRVDDVSGFTGLGWTLDVGGMLTRTIQNLPDEAASFLIPSKLRDEINYTDVNMADTLDQLEENNWEHEYDIWNYSFPGRSGKYILTSSNQYFQFQQSNLAFGYDGSSGNSQIVDENGILYEYYSQGTELTEYKDPITNQTKQAATMYPLTGIYSAKDRNNKIEIGYVAGPKYEHDRSANTYMLDDWWNNVPPYSDAFYYSPINNGGIQTAIYKVKYETLVPGEITFRSGKIYFIQDTTRKQLDTVKIYNSKQQLVRSVIFNIVPFDTSYHGNSSFANYKLESIEFRDSVGNLSERYAFNYIDESNPNAKPDAFDLTAGKDHWGFYNGDDGRATRIPSFNGYLRRGDGPNSHYTTIGGGAYLEPSETHTKAYVLNKITHPTGGWTVFEYEGNKTGGAASVNIGGLRIKKISNFSAEGELSTFKEYHYNATSLEILPNSGHYLTGAAGDGGTDLAIFQRITMSENPSLNFLPKGAPIAYGSVNETDGKGAIQYQYDNGPAYSYEEMNYPGNGYTGGPPNYYFKKFATKYKPWNFGNLTRKLVSTEISTQTTDYEYEEFVSDTLRDFLITRWITPECLLNQSPPNCNIPTGYDYSTPYINYPIFNFSDRFYYSGGKRLKQITESVSQDTVVMAVITEFFYENPAYPTVVTKKLTTDSRGDTIATRLKYPFDLAGQAVYDEMVNRNIIASPIEEEQKNETRNKILGKVKTNYAFWLDSLHVLPSSVQKATLSNPLTTELTFNAYDSSGNLLQATAKEGVVTSYIWGYERRFPVAKVSGKSYSDAITQSSLNLSVVNAPSSDAVLRTELNKLRTLTGAFTHSYTINPLVGVTSETDVRGQTQYYQHDAAGRLSIIKDNDSKILKIYRYSLYDRVTDEGKAAIWVNTGSTYCEKCRIDTNYATGMLRVQQIDTNSQSYTYNQYRWISTPSGSCVSTLPDWVDTDSLRCVVLSNGQNNGTGAQQKEQLCMNPCLSTYNTTRWVSNGINLTDCPAPSLYYCEENSGYFIKNDCGDLEKGDTIWVSIPAGSITSAISLDDANLQAQIYGQNYVNTNGGCSPDSIMLEFNALISGSSTSYDIFLTDHNNSSIIFSFLSTNYGLNNLGVIPAAYYDIQIIPVTSASTIDFEAGCSNYDTGVSVTFTNIKLYRDCKRITATE